MWGVDNKCDGHAMALGPSHKSKRGGRFQNAFHFSLHSDHVHELGHRITHLSHNVAAPKIISDGGGGPNTVKPTSSDLFLLSLSQAQPNFSQFLAKTPM